MTLTRLQRLYFWSGILLPAVSIGLYVLVPTGTVEYFGGTPTPSSIFWCTIAASGDVMHVILCACVLWYPYSIELRNSVLLANALYSIFHFGGFLRAHYTMEPHPQGPGLYIFGIVTSWAAYLAWGRRDGLGNNNDNNSNTALKVNDNNKAKQT